MRSSFEFTAMTVELRRNTSKSSFEPAGVVKKLGQVPIPSQACPNLHRLAMPIRWDSLGQPGTRLGQSGTTFEQRLLS